MAVVSLMLVVFSLTTGEFVVSGILPDVAGGLAIPLSAAGLLTTAYAIGMIAGGPVVTLLTARVSRKPLVIGLVTAAVLANAASAIAPSYPLLLVSRVLAGLVVATFFAVAIATAAAEARPGKQGSAVAKVALGLNLGIVLGAPLGTYVGQHLGWRATFWSVSAAAALALLAVLRFVPDRPSPTTGRVTGELRVFTDRRVQLAIALTAAGNVGVLTVFTYLAPLLTEVGGFPASAVPVLLLGYGAGAVLGNAVGGRLADRALLPSLAGLLAGLAGVLALAWLGAGNPVATAVSTVLLGALAFAIVPGMQTRVITAAGAAPTLAVAVNASGYQLAAALAGWLGGGVIETTGSPRPIYPVAAALTLGGLGIALYSLRQDRRARV
ncbi:MFS transporter [Amycolatopsis sp. A133]|uniref:MFS transporter n=1 Tax=Amycolatopsis sp. A133 TaxID=3064472 RepID=UPI0027E70A3F|nr:MFS transporter [Amycolatopsis sp. A133]MDQ7809515.1 MFS transporter [Amycolatopsis sp. A133]